MPDSISLCMAVGKAFRESSDIETLKGEVAVQELYVGTISKVELRTEGGFDFGIIYIDGVEAHAGKSVSIGFRNENMLLKYGSGEVLGTVPDLITLVDLDTLEPLTNADTKEGQNVAVFGLTVPET